MTNKDNNHELLNSLVYNLYDKKFREVIKYEEDIGYLTSKKTFSLDEKLHYYVLVGVAYQELGNLKFANEFFDLYLDNLKVSEDYIKEINKKSEDDLDEYSIKFMLLMSKIGELGFSYKVDGKEYDRYKSSVENTVKKNTVKTKTFGLLSFIKKSFLFIIYFPIIWIVFFLINYSFASLITSIIGLNWLLLLVIIFFIAGLIWQLFLIFSSYLIFFTSYLMPFKKVNLVFIILLGLLNFFDIVYKIWGFDDLGVLFKIISSLLIFEVTYVIIMSAFGNFHLRDEKLG